MAARGVPPTTAGGWYRDRPRTGHPEKAGGSAGPTTGTKTSGPRGARPYQRGKIGSLTRVDHSGGPDNLVDAAEAARMLRYSSRGVIHTNRRLGYFPEPDDYAPARRAAHPSMEALHRMGRR